MNISLSYPGEKDQREKTSRPSCQCGSTDLLIRPKGQHVGAWCNTCGRWLRWLPQNNSPAIMPFGCHKNLPISALPTDYIKFILINGAKLSVSLRKQLEEEFERRGGE